MTVSRIAVVGGGLAGIAAALACADGGAAVTLYESRRRLGGATFSVERDGRWLDNGQHVALRCCTAYRAFLDRLGVAADLDWQPRLRIPVLREGAEPAFLRRSGLPAPFHLSRSLLGYAPLRISERLAVPRAAFGLMRLDPDDTTLDSTSFGAWLRTHGQSAGAIEALWNLIALPTLNLTADDASLQQAVQVFRTGLLDTAEASDLGIPRVPLQQLHGDAAMRALTHSGVQVELGAQVHAVEPGRLALGDRTAEADAVIVAVPNHDAARLLPPEAVDAVSIEALGSSPIVNLHVHYDRRVLAEPFAAAVGSPVQWIFDRTESSGTATGQLISLSLSGADAEIDEPLDRLRQRYLPALARLMAPARAAAVLDVFAIREPRATFRAAPGSRLLRPQARTQQPGLYLAGAWTATGWPATMEGAVRSGSTAATAALEDLPDLRPRCDEPIGAAA